MDTKLKRGLGGLIFAGVVAAGAIAATGSFGSEDDGSGDDRQEVVAERGADVMPFDLDATTHRFIPTAYGGTETVTADDPSDQDEIELIRQHLREEATVFAHGDFKDPAQIHGAEMPGLATLEANADRIDIDYVQIETGARIRFSTDDNDLVSALHAWFDAQTSDHGSHAA